MLIAFFSASAISVQAAPVHFRVDLDGKENHVQLTAAPSDNMSTVPQEWISDPEAKKCTLMAWSKQKTQEGKWTNYAFSFTASCSGSVLISIGTMPGKDKKENDSIWVLLDKVSLNGKVFDFTDHYKTSDGRIVPTGFAASGKATLLIDAGENCPAMRVNHDSRLVWRQKVYDGESYELIFRVKSIPETESN